MNKSINIRISINTNRRLKKSIECLSKAFIRQKLFGTHQCVNSFDLFSVHPLFSHKGTNSIKYNVSRKLRKWNHVYFVSKQCYFEFA